MIEDEMVGWHHQLNGHKFEQILGDNEGQGRLMCCSPQGCEELEATQQVNNHNTFYYYEMCKQIHDKKISCGPACYS